MYVTENTQSGHFFSQYITGNTTSCGPVFRGARYNQLTIKRIVEIACLGMMLAHKKLIHVLANVKPQQEKWGSKKVVDTTSSICHIL